MMLINRQLAFDRNGRCVAAGCSCEVTPHVSTAVVALPTDHYDFLGPVQVVGKTMPEIETAILQHRIS